MIFSVFPVPQWLKIRPARVTTLNRGTTGLVKALEGSTPLTDMLLAMPEYMKPERGNAEGDARVGLAADHYALGIVAYHVLGKCVCFPSNIPGTLSARKYKPVRPPRYPCPAETLSRRLPSPSVRLLPGQEVHHQAHLAQKAIKTRFRPHVMQRGGRQSARFTSNHHEKGET
jgi:hypothetical protein